ncbi:hypothetical protein Btru_074072 [Bulinus truncatus]|nr:hypothetical protein Btru_074072 [Bulinus truncatus]
MFMYFEKMELLIVFLALLAGGKSQLVFTVTPEFVESGVTPSLTLDCVLLGNEDLQVLTLTIYREITRGGSPVRESVATINSMGPQAPIPMIPFPRLNVTGEIFEEAEEALSYLRVIWPRPNTDDLGLYTCEARVLGEYGELLPLKAVARLSSANPVQDRLLAIVQVLASRLEGFNQTVASLEQRLENITTQSLENERVLLEKLAALENQTSLLLSDVLAESLRTTAAAEATAGLDETTVALDEATELVEDITEGLQETTTVLEEGTDSEGLTPSTTATVKVEDTLLVRLIANIRILTSRLDVVNTTVAELEEKVSSIEPLDEPAKNETEVIPGTEVLEARLQELTTLVETLNTTIVYLEQKLETLEAKEENETTTVTDKAEPGLDTETNETKIEQAIESKMSQRIELISSQLENFTITIQTLDEKVSSYIAKELAEENEVENKTEEKENGEDIPLTLTATVQVLSSQLESVNATLSALESKLFTLESKETENVTKPEPVEELSKYFVTMTSSYFLFKGTKNTDSYKAQAVCETKQLYLAEINDQAEYDIIEIEIASFAVDDSPVLIAGKKRADSNEWISQSTGAKVSFFDWGAGEPVMASLSSDCLALKITGGLAEMVSVPCSADRYKFYFLCEKSLQ